MTFFSFVLSLRSFLKFMSCLRLFGRLSFQHALRFFVVLSDLCKFSFFFRGLLMIAVRRKFNPKFWRHLVLVMNPNFLFFLKFLVFLWLWKDLLQLTWTILMINFRLSLKRNPNLVNFQLLIKPLFSSTLYFFYAYLQIILLLI